MDKKKAISIITKAAKLYHDNLEDQKVLFIYGISKEINVQINVSACMGFISDKHTKLNVPNTLLASDIRDISSKPQHKIYAILSKSYTDDTYSIIEKCEPKLDISNVESIKELITVCTKK